MRPASAQFLASLRFSHTIAAQVDLFWPDTPTVAHAVPVQAGMVTIDRTAQNRRAGQVIIPWRMREGEDLGLDLRTLTLGGYALVKRGLRYASGAVELITIGKLRVESVTWDTLEGSASIELADRMAQVRDEPFTAPFSGKGKRPAAAAVQIIQQVFGATIAYHTPYDPAGPLGDVTFSGQREDALSALEEGYAAETYFDADGDFVFAAKPADTDPIVWVIDAGQSGVMEGASENVDRTGIYNGVLVTGQPTSDLPPVSALAIFTDPTSPIRWGGPFGKVALLADSTTVTTTAQAAATAQSLLRLRLKQTRSLTLSAAPNPALEAGDAIEVRFPDGRDERHLIDAVTVDLGTDAQQIITRTQAAPVPVEALTGEDAVAELADTQLVAA